MMDVGVVRTSISLLTKNKCVLADLRKLLWPTTSTSKEAQGGLIGSAKCPHAYIQGAFWHCTVSQIYMGGGLALQSVPMPIYRGLFGVAHCPKYR